MQMQDRLRNSFIKGYDYTIGVKEIVGIPIELPKWEKITPATYDGEGNELTPPTMSGEYYSMAEVSAELGNLFVPIPYLKDGYGLAHYSYDFGEKDLMINFLDGKTIHLEEADIDVTLSCMNIDGVGDNIPAELIEYDKVGDNEFGIFSAREIDFVPKSISVPEEPPV